MSTKTTVEHQFDAGVEPVFAMYSKKEFFTRKYQELGFENIEITDYKVTASGFSVTARYDAKNDAPLPDFAKKFMSSTVTIVQTDTWDNASKTGKLAIEIKGVPVKVSAEMKLVSRGSGSVNQMAFVLSCGIPLIGGKLESVLADDIKAKASKDEAVSRKLLKELS